MRWDQLFDDLETQLENEMGAEELDLAAEEERLRLGRLSLRDRLLAMQPSAGAGLVRLTLRGDERVIVAPQAFGRDWLAGELIAESHRRTQCIIPLWAVAAVALAPDDVASSLGSAPEASARVIDRIGFTFVVRDLCRRRASVSISTSAGSQHGTIDRAGRDHFDLAVHEVGQPRRAALVREIRIVPFAEVRIVRV